MSHSFRVKIVACRRIIGSKKIRLINENISIIFGYNIEFTKLMIFIELTK